MVGLSWVHGLGQGADFLFLSAVEVDFLKKVLVKYNMCTGKCIYPKGAAFEFLQIKLVHVTRSRNTAILYPRVTYYGPFWSLSSSEGHYPDF